MQQDILTLFSQLLEISPCQPWLTTHYMHTIEERASKQKTISAELSKCMGMDEWMINLFKDYMAAYSSGWGDFVTDDFKKVTGKNPRSFKQFATDFAGVFGKK